MQKDYKPKTKKRQFNRENDILVRSYIKALIKKIKPSNIAELSGVSIRSVLRLSKGEMSCSAWHFNKIQKLYNQFYGG